MVNNEREARVAVIVAVIMSMFYHGLLWQGALLILLLVPWGPLFDVASYFGNWIVGLTLPPASPVEDALREEPIPEEMLGGGS